MIARSLVYLGFIIAATGLAAGADKSAERPLRVLFVGNSYTQLNDLPKLTAELAASARPPRKLETEFVGEGGATLKRHWDAGPALDAIRKRTFDYVILQDQGTLGQSADFRTISDPEMFHAYARKFDAEIRNAGAKTIFFLTWARQDAPEDQRLLTNAYASIVEELRATVAPVGIAWRKALQENPKLVLHDADRSHPGPAGSYLAACVFHAVLFSSSPEGATRGKLSEEEAGFLQRIAWETAKDPKQTLAAAKLERIEAAAAAGKPAQPEATTTEALQRGRAILAAAQKGAGGLERLRAVKDVSATFSGKAFSPMGEMPFDSRETIVFPSVLRNDTKLPFGETISFFDGGNGWRKGPRGVQDVPDRMKPVLRAQTFRNTLNLLRAEGEHTVQFEKREKAGEQEADVILISKEGESVRLFISPSGRLLKKTYRAVGMGGPADFEETYSDYREVSGLMIPFGLQTTQNGAAFLTATISEVKFDTGVVAEELGKRPGN